MKDGDDAAIDSAIAAYTGELQVEAELGRAEIAELEDHLRQSIRELREHGLPATQAIAEAARRLGNPRAIARESARVRSAFGAKLSRARTWSIVALMVPLLASGFANVTGVWSRNMIELAGGSLLALALTARLTWARPILLGGLAFWTLAVALFWLSFPGANPAWLVVHLGLVTFLAPWRRGEITAVGATLALQVWAFGAATFALGFQLSTPHGSIFVAPGAELALGAALIATCGGILRATWSAFASLVATAGLTLAFVQLAQLTFRMSAAEPTLFRIAMLSLVGSGAVAGAVAAVLAWRHARSHVGSLRALAS